MFVSSMCSFSSAAYSPFFSLALATCYLLASCFKKVSKSASCKYGGNIGLLSIADTNLTGSINARSIPSSSSSFESYWGTWGFPSPSNLFVALSPCLLKPNLFRNALSFELSYPLIPSYLGEPTPGTPESRFLRSMGPILLRACFYWPKVFFYSYKLNLWEISLILLGFLGMNFWISL